MAQPWLKYQGQTAPAQDPVIAPADPYKQAAETRAQQDQSFQAAANARADRAEQRASAADARSAESAARAEQSASRLSVSDNDALRRKVSAFAKLFQSAQQFQDDYSGLGAGIENTVQAYSPVQVGTPGQRDWWANFAAADNLIRNELFGASLSGGEKSAYGATTVQPGMNPQEVRANLGRRVEEARGELSRIISSLEAAGYNKQQIDALTGDFGAVIRGEQRLAADATPMFQQGDGNTAGVTRDNGDSTLNVAVAQDGYNRSDNPALAGVRDEYIRRLGEGQSAEEIIRWAKTAGVDPSAFGSISEQVRFRKQNPNVPLNQYDTTQLDDQFTKLSGFDSALNSLAQSPVGAGLIAAGDAASAFTLDNIVGGLGGNAERARLGMGQVAAQNPYSSALGTMIGGAGMALGGEAALGARGMAAGLGRSLVADTAYGAAAGAGAADNGRRLEGAVFGAGAGAAGSLAGNAVGNALGKMARGVSDTNVNALQREGVNALTMGSTYGNSGRIGQAVRSVEDRLSGMPIVGDAVNARRSESFRQFNEAAFNKALEPIGGSVSGKVGEEAIGAAQQQVSDAFTRALAGKGAAMDRQFVQDFSGAFRGVQSIKRLGDELADEVRQIVEPYASAPLLSGEALDDISRSLRDLRARYMSDPLGVRVARQIDRVERSVFDLFDRQASGTVQGYSEARAAYRRLSILEDAALKARNQKDRIFTPAQLGQADRTNTVRYGGKRAAARGDTPFYDLQTAAQDVLPNKVPDSGTAGRLLVPLALVSGGAGVDQATGGTTGLTLGAILAAAYSKTGQRLLTKPGRGMKPGTARNVLENPKTRAAIGAAGAAGAVASLPNQR